MRKRILILLLIVLSLTITGCNYIQEKKAKSYINNYYQSIMDEDYEEAFEQLHLFDFETSTEESKLSEGTVLSNEKAKQFYLDKIEVLKNHNYKLVDYEIGEVEYADGHTFWYHINLEVERNEELVEWNEVAHLYEGKLLVGGRDDPFVIFRDGKMNFEIDELE
ncbi:hypothetical protein SAMN05216389_101180 [Oceanobacillus limi]|uniref:NTF2-like N-terminal transpeptidase domain-containing protein n=1 Tax=Oceanobacillus limi TaxID=930131 RepID=A0A1H9Y5E3_9BACI|nr:hypothetical protein [Oceanobacillus limi]SES63599.1 hypothetical protein SAMN05216389_101180 [Oceanobacillus limi]